MSHSVRTSQENVQPYSRECTFSPEYWLPVLNTWYSPAPQCCTSTTQQYDSRQQSLLTAPRMSNSPNTKHDVVALLYWYDYVRRRSVVPTLLQS